MLLHGLLRLPQHLSRPRPLRGLRPDDRDPEGLLPAVLEPGPRGRRAPGRCHGKAKAVYFLQGVGACHQLFFAEMVITRGARTTPPPTHRRRGRPATPPPAPAGRPHSRWVQPRLFDVRRDFTRHNQQAHADAANPAGNPWLAWAYYLAYRRGEARGWRPKVHAEVRRALAIVLAGFADGDVVRYSELVAAMRALGIRVESGRRGPGRDGRAGRRPAVVVRGLAGPQARRSSRGHRPPRRGMGAHPA